MELALVKNLTAARPFKPFKLVLPNDREIPIPQPEFISISPSGITAAVWYKDGGGEWVDLRLDVTAREDRKSA